MTDSPDFILARIAEVQSQIHLNDLSIKILAAVAIVHLVLLVALIVADRLKGELEFDLVFLAGAWLLTVFLLAAVVCGSLVYDNFAMQVTLDQLIAQYEAIYGPLPIR